MAFKGIGGSALARNSNPSIHSLPPTYSDEALDSRLAANAEVVPGEDATKYSKPLISGRYSNRCARKAPKKAPTTLKFMLGTAGVRLAATGSARRLITEG